MNAPFMFTAEDFEKCALKSRHDLKQLMADTANARLQQWIADAPVVFLASFVTKLVAENASLLTDLNKSEEVSAKNRELVLLLREAREAMNHSLEMEHVGPGGSQASWYADVLKRIDAALGEEKP